MSPAVIVETMTFGKPIGRARMAAVQMEVPPLPPSEMIPWILPDLASLETISGMPLDIVATAMPRSFFSRIWEIDDPAARATRERGISDLARGRPLVPTSMRSG